MRSITIPFALNNTNIPIIKFQLKDGTYTFGFCDTGSEMTVVNKSFCKVFKDSFDDLPVDKMMEFVGVSGVSSVPLVQKKTIFRFNAGGESMSFPYTCTAMDLVHMEQHFKDICEAPLPVSILLGGDFLDATHAIIDYEKKEITLQKDDLSCEQ